MWIRETCPYCLERLGTPDERQSYGFNTETGWWHCFRCKAQGKRVKPGDPWDAPVEKPKLEVVKKLPECCYPADQNRFAFDYLLMRNVPLWQMRKHDLLYCEAYPFHNRVLFWVHEPELWYQGRILWNENDPEYDPHTPKYLGAKWPKRSAVYECAVRKCLHPETAFVVEGPMDALAIERVGYVGVALFGSGITMEQAKYLSKFERCVIVLDNDHAGANAQKVAWAMRFYVPTHTLALPVKYKDAAEMPGQELHDWLTQYFILQEEAVGGSGERT